MMIRLRKMSEEDFFRFREYSISDYAETMFKAGNLDKKQALLEAEGEFNKLLENGLHTPNQFLMVIEGIKKNAEIGWLWYMYEEDESCKKAFICDFLIFEEERRKGYEIADNQDDGAYMIKKL